MKSRKFDKQKIRMVISIYNCFFPDKPLWRNWLARSAVNRKAGGSSPPGGEIFCHFFINIRMIYLLRKHLKKVYQNSYKVIKNSIKREHVHVY